MSYLDDVLEFLAERQGSHTLSEISRSTSIPCDLCKEIVHFLAEFGFVNLNAEVEIEPKARSLVLW